jgi:hypothetical protein
MVKHISHESGAKDVDNRIANCPQDSDRAKEN